MRLKTKNQIMEKRDVALVIVAHADDETLGAGGTIAKHAERGESVYCLSMTDGIGARGAVAKSETQKRRVASENAAKTLGFIWLEGGRFPDNALDTVPLLEIVKVIEKVKSAVNPTLVYTHSAADLNIDHRIVNQAVLTAFRPQPNEKCVEIRAFEVPSATDFGSGNFAAPFTPNLYIGIEKTWAKKLNGLIQYKSEMRPAPHARSLEGLETLAKYRGNQAGLPMAEAFQILRKIER